MDYPPSTYTPFFRRFTNEREREIGETKALYEWVRGCELRSPDMAKAAASRIYEYFDHLSDPIERRFCYCLAELLMNEPYLFPTEGADIGRLSLKEFVQFRNLLLAKQYFFTNQDALLQLLHEGLVRVLYGTASELPEIEDPSPFTIPLIYALPNPRLSVEQFLGTLADDQYIDRGIFRRTANRLFHNARVASGITDPESKKPIKLPTETTMPLNELNDAYLAGTPFHELMKTPVPLKLTHDERMNHMHIVGGAGAGKTTLLENLILHDVRSADPPSMVVIEPHSDLIRKIVHADLGIQDRLILIDPRDTEFPLALNPFAINRERLATYDRSTQEQVTAGVIQTLDYLFSSLFDLKLTGKQAGFFRYIIRLLLTLPEVRKTNATVLDMMKLMKDASAYNDVIEALPEIPKEFFQVDFAGTTYKDTRDQIRYRLMSLIENPTLARLFTAPENKVDFFTEINRGAVILIDTAKDFLKEGSSVFGRIMISLVLQAVQERAAIPPSRRKDCFLIVDEAASYFDQNIDDLLTDARKYRCGCVFAHQYLGQASHELRASLAANTSTKFVSGVSASDARVMSHELRTTHEFILAQPRLQFAAHIRNITPQAVSIPVKVGVIDRLPKLSHSAYERLIHRNRARVAVPLLKTRNTEQGAAEPPPSQTDDDDWSKWENDD